MTDLQSHLSLCRDGLASVPHSRQPVRDARNDPTDTTPLRNKMKAEADRRWATFGRTLRQALVEHDFLGLLGMGRLPHADKTEGFNAWVQSELAQKVFAQGLWLKPYVVAAAATAQEQADKRAPGGRVDPSRVSTMHNLATAELKGIVEAAQQQLVRVATQAMLAAKKPTAMANELAGVIRTMRQRTRAMCEDIIARTHATSTLSAYRSAGVTHVGIIPEHVRSTTHGLVADARRPRTNLPPIRVSTAALVQRARRFWRERFQQMVRRFGRERAVARLQSQLQTEERRLARAGESFRQRLGRGTEEFVARRQAEGELLRARQAAYREELFAWAQSLVSPGAKAALERRRAGPGALTRAETPSPRTIQRIERAQRRLEQALGGEGGLVNVITAGDDFVCQLCEDISDDSPYTLEEAEGLIPAHPNCRCAFVPASRRAADGFSPQTITKVMAAQQLSLEERLGDEAEASRRDRASVGETRAVEIEAATDAEAKGHPFRGNQYTGGIEGEHEMGQELIAGYTTVLNNALTTGKAKNAQQVMADIPKVDRMIANAPPLAADTKVYRITSQAALEGKHGSLEEGQYREVAGYTSVARSIDTAWEYAQTYQMAGANPVLVQATLPKGTRALDMGKFHDDPAHPHDELMLGRQSRWKVESVGKTSPAERKATGIGRKVVMRFWDSLAERGTRDAETSNAELEYLHRPDLIGAEEDCGTAELLMGPIENAGQSTEGAIKIDPGPLPEILISRPFLTSPGEVLGGEDEEGAAGLLFMTPDGHLLLMRRGDTDTDAPGQWSIPAGMLEADEDPLRGAQREAAEEAGHPGDHHATKIDERVHNGIRFHTFLQPVAEQFDPLLNSEHDQYGWFHPTDLPKPLHPGLAATLRKMNLIDEEPGHPFRGNQYAVGQSGPNITPAGVDVTKLSPSKAAVAWVGHKIAWVKNKERAWNEKPRPTKVALTKQQTGFIAENLAVALGKDAGLRDARIVPDTKGTKAVDVIQDHQLIEVKGGAAANGESAMQWRISKGGIGEKERAWNETASAEDKRIANARDVKASMMAKSKLMRDMEKQTGRKWTGKTMTFIIHPETMKTGMADVYAFKGFHTRIGWKSEEARKAYVGTVRYG